MTVCDAGNVVTQTC